MTSWSVTPDTAHRVADDAGATSEQLQEKADALVQAIESIVSVFSTVTEVGGQVEQVLTGHQETPHKLSGHVAKSAATAHEVTNVFVSADEEMAARTNQTAQIAINPSNVRKFL